MIRDLRFDLRLLRRHPTFACAAIAVLALGIGAATAVFSVLRGLLIEPLPYRDPDRLALIRADVPGAGRTSTLTSLEFHALRARTDLFASVAAAVIADSSVAAGDLVVPASGAAVSENFFDTLGVPLAFGRTVGPARGGPRTVNLGYDFWQRHLRGDPAIMGSTIQMNGAPAIVAGVLPRRFKAYLGASVSIPSQLDVVSFRSSGYDDDPFRGNVVVARLRRDLRAHGRAQPTGGARRVVSRCRSASSSHLAIFSSLLP